MAKRLGLQKKRSLSSGAKKPRRYNNTLRQLQSEATQQKIILTTVSLLVKRRGGDVTIQEVAKASKISERTVFRFFKDKESLRKASNDYLLAYLQEGMKKLDDQDLPTFARETISSFDKNEDLLLAYLFSSFGKESRLEFRRNFTQLLLSKLGEVQTLKTRSSKLHAALVVSLINANLWHDMRNDFGYSGKEIGEAVEWAIERLISKPL